MKIFEQHRQYQPLALGLIPALAATVAYFFFSPAMIPTNIDKMIMFGDSLTQQAWIPGGTGAALQDHYQRKFDVLNRGFGGYNTRWAKELVPHIFNNTRDTALVTVWFGANDAVLEWRGQHASLEEFKSNLVDIVAPLKERKTRVLLLTPPPFCPVMRRADVDRRFPDQNVKLDRTVERTASFAEAVKEVAQQLQVPCIDVHQAFESVAASTSDGDRAKGLAPLLSDGLHLTAQGYKIVSAALHETIKSSWPELDADKIARRYPTWDQIDPKDHKKIFAQLS